MRPRVVVVAGWYPNDESPYSGVFVRDQVRALLPYCDVAVIYVQLGAESKRPELREEDGIVVARAAVAVDPRPRGRAEAFAHLERVTLGYSRSVDACLTLLRTSWGAPQVVHAQVLGPAGYAALYLKMRRHIPYIVTEHSAEFLPETGEYWGRGRVARWLMRRAATEAHRVLAVSRYQMEAMKAAGVVGRFEIVPNVVRGSSVMPYPQAPPYRIGHVSLMIDRSKNISGLLEAVLSLTKRRDDFQLELVGDGPDREALEQRARQLGLLGRRVRFIGAVEAAEVVRFLSSVHATVVSSNYETFCLAAAESVACGRPVISTQCGGPEEFIDDEVGILVPRADPEALAEGIDTVLSNLAAFDPARVAGHAGSRFAPEVVGKRLADLYVSAITGDR